MAEAENPDVGYERRDVGAGLVGWLAIGLVLVVGVAIVTLALTFPDALRERPIRLAPPPPTPRLQTDEPADLARFRAAEEKRLKSYGWIDRSRGVVRIPIDQAMQDIAREGAPQWPQSAR